jgi:hypothetical protein
MMDSQKGKKAQVRNTKSKSYTVIAVVIAAFCDFNKNDGFAENQNHTGPRQKISALPPMTDRRTDGQTDRHAVFCDFNKNTSPQMREEYRYGHKEKEGFQPPESLSFLHRERHGHRL